MEKYELVNYLLGTLNTYIDLIVYIVYSLINSIIIITSDKW